MISRKEPSLSSTAMPTHTVDPFWVSVVMVAGNVLLAPPNVTVALSVTYVTLASEAESVNLVVFSSSKLSAVLPLFLPPACSSPTMTELVSSAETADMSIEELPATAETWASAPVICSSSTNFHPAGSSKLRLKYSFSYRSAASLDALEAADEADADALEAEALCELALLAELALDALLALEADELAAWPPQAVKAKASPIVMANAVILPIVFMCSFLSLRVYRR